MRRKAKYDHLGFKKISDFYYGQIIQRNPILATWMGEHAYDSLLPETGAEAIEKNIAFLREMRDAFNSLNENELSLDEKLDCETINHFIGQQLFMEENLQRWKLGRDLAMNIGDALFLLFTRNYAPLNTRVENIIARLRAAPAYLYSGRTLFQKVPALWAEIYIESARNLPTFIDTIGKSLASKISPVLLTDFNQAAIEAKKALADYITWFNNAIAPKANAQWALGEGAFQAFLANRQIGLDKSEILEMGQASLQMANEQLEKLSNKIIGNTHASKSSQIAEAHKRINQKTPANFEAALSAYKTAVKNGRSFVQQSGFASLPEQESLDIIETPDFMAHLIPFSAYIGPERTCKNQNGTYLLTRVENVSRYSYAEIANSAIHEIYPGHHLQLTGHNLHESKMRSFSECLEIIEGWAHYCEEEVINFGLEVSDASRFTRAADEVFNCARLMIDVKLQSREWSFEQALRHLMEQGRLDRNSAMAELRRYTQSPGAQISNVTGKHLLNKIKSRLKKTYGNDFNSKIFHDLIIYEGSIPIHLAQRYYSEIFKQQLQDKGGAKK